MKSPSQQLAEALAGGFIVVMVQQAEMFEVENMPGFVPAYMYGSRTPVLNERELGAVGRNRYVMTS